MRGDRKKRLSEQFAQLAAEYFKKEASRHSLITVTRADVSPDLKHATVYITVLPENKEISAINFAKRHGSDFRSFVKKQLDLRVIPFFDFKIDEGEKNFYRVIENM